MSSGQRFNRRVSFPLSIAVLSVIYACFLCNFAIAQNQTGFDTALVNKRLETLHAEGGADNSDVVSVYTETRDLLARAESFEREATDYIDAIATAPMQESEIQDRIDALDTWVSEN